ncbi:hypothetical protein CCAND93_380037 [Capnocytophaga canis]|uniref:Uncharacterized protein n=1 Tax=Capnocytophaga canis TaxID=1848903 RepID=A0A0B7IMP7_9FLAO|nr:hypothetical protein CCAND93_380037 [Capnocytophaga canis]
MNQLYTKKVSDNNTFKGCYLKLLFLKYLLTWLQLKELRLPFLTFPGK